MELFEPLSAYNFWLSGSYIQALDPALVDSPRAVMER